mgnify:CR=1 FL=1
MELKARFDEENNLATAEMMKAAGINIIYSIPGLKVHAKVALIRRRSFTGEKIHSYAYISTGNFNEKTATLYADCGLFTSNPVIVHDLTNLFRTLRGKENPRFTRLLVARFNLIPELNRLIDKEIELAEKGRGGRIILKMNALQDPIMIDRLYEASQKGVKIDLIVRGICCLIPGQEYSCNIRVTRIVDSFLEHARIWYFGNAGHPKVYMGSPDWMRRNLYRRIEAVVPILDNELREEIVDMLHIQLSDNQKACFVDDKLNNIFKFKTNAAPVRAQYTFYNYLKEKNETFSVTCMTFLCNTKIRPLQPEITYTFMETIYLCIIIFLFVLAVFDLMVGVSNDAVNFLNSAVGAKAASFKTILFIAGAGIFIGASLSNGMMDIARHGIYQPEHFYFAEIMCILLAVMLTDVVLLDVFNSMGMPTSTTVSMVFELLGGTFALALIKVHNSDTLGLGDLINTDKALSVIMAIFVSVAIAFFFGMLVQWLARMVFTFNYKSNIKYSIALFGGIASTAIVYFMVIKGLKDSSFMTPENKQWVQENTMMLVSCFFVISTILMQILHWLKVNVFKVVVFAGYICIGTGICR